MPTEDSVEDDGGKAVRCGLWGLCGSEFQDWMEGMATINAAAEEGSPDAQLLMGLIELGYFPPPIEDDEGIHHLVCYEADAPSERDSVLVDPSYSPLDDTLLTGREWLEKAAAVKHIKAMRVSVALQDNRISAIPCRSWTKPSARSMRDDVWFKFLEG